jgi:putative tricarboxylic transport membrane protein
LQKSLKCLKNIPSGRPTNRDKGELLLRAFFHKRDFYAGILLIAFGCVAIIGARQNPFGTLMHMGPGFFPSVLGVILIGIGILVALMALGSLHEADRILPEHPEWLGWTCIIAGPALFMICGEYGGMAPGIFACVFVSALGDRDSTFKGSTVLGLVMTSFGANLFSLVLQVPMPVVRSMPVGIVLAFYSVAVLCYFVFRPLTQSLFVALAVTLVVPALYTVAIFFVPAAASFILAGALTYFALRQAAPRALTSLTVEAIPPVFAALNLCYFWLFRQVFPLEGPKAFWLAVLAAGLLAAGLFFPPASPAKPAEPARASGLFERGEALLPLALACAFAALNFGYFWLVQGDASPDWKLIGTVWTGNVVLFGATLWSGLHFAPTGPTGSDSRLHRFNVTAVPSILACAIVIFALAWRRVDFLFPSDTTAPLAVAVILAAMFVVGAIFAPGARTPPTMDGTAEASRTLFPRGEVLMPYLLALVVAIAAAEYIVFFAASLIRGIQ